MERILSTYIYAHQPLAPPLLASIARAGIHNLEIFCDASHFNYGDPQSVRELAGSLTDYAVTVHALHAPTDRDAAGGRSGGIAISIADPERIRRIEAVDEMKRALDVAEKIPFRYFALHLASGRQSADPRKFDAAFNSLEHLATFAKARGVAIALQNTPNELGSPASLAQFLKECATTPRTRMSTIITAKRTSTCCPTKARLIGTRPWPRLPARPNHRLWCWS
jgi:sugar phosphate isomerase/epimerase